MCSVRLQSGASLINSTPSQHAALGENVLQVAEAVQRLPDAQREAIQLHYLEGLKLSEEFKV